VQGFEGLVDTGDVLVHALEDVGVDETGLDGVDVDAVRGVLECRRAGELEDGAFARAVGRGAGEADAGKDGGDVDDPAAVDFGRL